MKTVMTHISNRLMEVSIADTLTATGNFVVCTAKQGGGDILKQCMAAKAQIVLMEVDFNPGFTIDERLLQVRMMRSEQPFCKLLLLCDENSTPELARKVACAKRDGVIDDFIYSSVSESYLTALLYAM